MKLVVDPAVRPRGSAQPRITSANAVSTPDLEAPRGPAQRARGAEAGRRGITARRGRRPPDEVVLDPHREEPGAVGGEEGARLEVGADAPTRRAGGRRADASSVQVVGGGSIGMSLHLIAMGSLAQIRVGDVTIGGGAPVVVQSMTLTKTHDVEATTAQIAALASAGCEVVRCAVPKIEDADALREDRPALADPRDRRHPLQRLARAPGDRRRRRRRPDQPRQHRRPRQGRARRQGREEGRDPDADRRQLGLAAGAPAGARAAGPGRGARRGGARGGRAAREARLPRLQDLGQGDARADDDPRLPDARRQGSVSAPPRRHGGGNAVRRARSRARSGSARCSRTGSATRSASRSPPTRSRRSRSPGRS